MDRNIFLMHLPLIALAALALAPAEPPRTAVVPAATSGPPAARRILFLGDSITYGGLYVEFVEAFLRLRFPDWPGEVLNLGLPSETVSGLSEEGHAGGAFPRPNLHERLGRVLAQTRPDLVLACYGMNDGIYLPWSDDRFAAFRDGVLRLREKVRDAGASLVLLTPPVFDPVAAGQPSAPGQNYNEVLDRYAAWLLSQRAQGWSVLDLHGPMNRALGEGRERDPAFKLAGDGVHPGELGHWLMARPVLAFFGASAALTESSSAEALRHAHPSAPALLAWVQQRQRLLKDAWLTATGHQRPGMSRGLPLDQAQAQADDRLVDPIALPPLLLDGQPARAHTQGLELVDHQFYVTARREDVPPKRALLLRTAPSRTDWDFWDITPLDAQGQPTRLDHPGGLQSDGTRLWIPLAESRPQGHTLIRAYPIAQLRAGQPIQPQLEIRVADHIGALAVSPQEDLLLGANWDTLEVLAWNLGGRSLRTFSRAEAALRGLGQASHPAAQPGLAVQDWKLVGGRLVAAGLMKGANAPAQSWLTVFDAFGTPEVRARSIRLPRARGSELGREGMAVDAAWIYFLPEDLGATNRMFRSPLRALVDMPFNP